MNKGKEYLPGDEELFDMMDARFQSAPEQVKPIAVPARRDKRGHRVADSVFTTLFFLTATVQGWMDWRFGAIVTLACFCRLCRRIWRWRHG